MGVVTARVGVASEAGIKGSARRQMVVVIAIVVATVVVAVAVAIAVGVEATKARTGETKAVLVVTKSAVIAWVVIK